VQLEGTSVPNTTFHIFVSPSFRIILKANFAVGEILTFFFTYLWGWSESKSTITEAICWPIVPALDDRWWWLWSSCWNEWVDEELKYSENTRPSAALSTTDPTWLDPGSIPDSRCGKPVTSRLSYGTAQMFTKHHEVLNMQRITAFASPGMGINTYREISCFHGGDYEECSLLRCDAVFFVRTNVSEERIASIIRTKRLSKLGTFFSSWWWRRHALPKRRFLEETHGNISQKKVL
jgi:hypothetical protein